MTILIFIIVLSVLIFVHELGHFIAAKRSGVRVYEFAIGFPPTLYKKVVNGTAYLLNALPFGGYVRILGESGEGDVPEDKKDDAKPEENFANKSTLIKTYVLMAGVLMNMILAWLLFSIVLMFGYPMPTAEIRPGDKQFVTGEKIIITGVADNSPADEVGIVPGDVIVSVTDGARSIEPATAEEFGTFIRASESERVDVTVVRGGEEMGIAVAPTLGVGNAEGVRAIGVSIVDVSVVQYPVYRAIFEGAVWTVNATVNIVLGISGFFADIFRGEADLANVAGPVGIAGLVGDAFSIGILYLLAFTAIISINLAIINLLPIPALDGGRILFTWIEALKGSPISTKTQLIANGIGFAFLILLMVAVTINDIRNLFT
jgi:regulator of sigma E protease